MATVVDSPYVDSDFRQKIQYKIICVKGAHEVGKFTVVGAG
jgi:hypothetical protein